MYHYVYRITNIHKRKHYYGVRTSKCAPKDDIGVIYFSSSKDKEFIKDQKENPQNYKYKIIKICETRLDAARLEIELHSKFNVGVNESFYNLAKSTTTKFNFKVTSEIAKKSAENTDQIAKGKKIREVLKYRKKNSADYCQAKLINIYDNFGNLIFECNGNYKKFAVNIKYH